MNEGNQLVLAAVEKAVGAESPESVAFRRLLERGEACGIEELLDAVDDSDYSLADWVGAFAAFDEWLEEKGEKRRPLAEMRGYIHCCTYTNSPHLGLPSLKVIVIKSLTEFGFDAVSEPQY
jgi:hypothetical protein